MTPDDAPEAKVRKKIKSYFKNMQSPQTPKLKYVNHQLQSQHRVALLMSWMKSMCSTGSLHRDSPGPGHMATTATPTLTPIILHCNSDMTLHEDATIIRSGCDGAIAQAQRS